MLKKAIDLNNGVWPLNSFIQWNVVIWFFFLSFTECIIKQAVKKKKQPTRNVIWPKCRSCNRGVVPVRGPVQSCLSGLVCVQVSACSGLSFIYLFIYFFSPTFLLSLASMLCRSNHTSNLPIRPRQPWLIEYVRRDESNQMRARVGGSVLCWESCVIWVYVFVYLSVPCWAAWLYSRHFIQSISSKGSIDKWTLFEYLCAAGPR